MDLRRRLLGHSWAQLVLTVAVVILANAWAARTFWRVDLTEDRLFSLDLVTRALVARLGKPLTARVYFTRGLEAPYNNHEQLVVDKLEDLRAYSKGWMEVEVVDPSDRPDAQEEAKRFGIEPIQYRFRSSAVTEMKQVWMGAALIYGDRQESLTAITVTENLEYDLARALKRLLSDQGPRTIGWSTSFGEPDLFAGGQTPLERIRAALADEYLLQPVTLGGPGGVPEEVDVLYVVGPQRPVSERAQYQIDQHLMRGGALAVFLTNTKPDMRTLRPQAVYHGLEGLVGAYGVQVNRDLVVDRAHSGMMNFPVRQGNSVVSLPLNYPLIPKSTALHGEHPAVRGLTEMLFPFASSLTVAEALPPGVESAVLAASDATTSGRLRGVVTLDPSAFKARAPGEEVGASALMVAMSGPWASAFASRELPRPMVDGQPGDPDDPGSRIREGAPARLVVAGSADFVANNIAFMLNLTDWLAEDESLIGIRSKAVKHPQITAPSPERAQVFKLVNLLGGSVLLAIFSLGRWLMRRPPAGGAA